MHSARLTLTSTTTPLTLRHPVHTKTINIKAFGGQDGPFSSFKRRVEDALFNSDPTKDVKLETSPPPCIDKFAKMMRDLAALDPENSQHASPSYSEAESEDSSPHISPVTTSSLLSNLVKKGIISKRNRAEALRYSVQNHNQLNSKINQKPGDAASSPTPSSRI